MEQKNIISIIGKLAKNIPLTKQETEINERAIKAAKANGITPCGQFNFETRDAVYLPPLREATKGVLTTKSDVQKIVEKCIYLPNCKNSIKVPFIDFNLFSWGDTTQNGCVIDSAKMSAKRLSTQIDISLEIVNNTNDDFQQNFQNAILDALMQKVFATAFSTRVGNGTTTPSGILSNTTATPLTNINDLMTIQKAVDLKADGAVWLCSPTAKAALNAINAETQIFADNKLLNSEIIFTNLVEDGYLCYVDLSKFAVCEFGVCGLTIDNYTQKIYGKIRVTIEGYFDFDLADKNCISVGQFTDAPF